MKSRATLKFTSASSNARRTSRNASATFSSEIFPSPRRFLKTFWSFPDRLSNMRARYENPARIAIAPKGHAAHRSSLRDSETRGSFCWDYGETEGGGTQGAGRIIAESGGGCG